MTNDELNALRILLREEVNAAVYASEQRTGERMDRLREEVNAAVYASEQRMGERMDRLREEVNAAVYASEHRTGERMDRLEGEQRELRLAVARVDVQLSEAILVLNGATNVINDLRFSQHALETKVEENLLSLKRDMQKLTDSVHTFSRHFIAISQTTDERITTHERMRIGETHPYPPHSAA